MIEDLKSTITHKFIFQLEEMGIKTDSIHRNLPVENMVDLTVQKKEGFLTSTGALSVRTGKYTGRSPDDRYIVDDNETHNKVDWGKVNHPFPEEKFERLFEKMRKHLEKKEIFVFDGFIGADPNNRLPIRIINDHVWQNLFTRQMFIRPTSSELKKAMFSVMNYILPDRGVFPMHCSANIGRNGDTALFFGLSGTGKTTLSADSNRMLIGDDEHGWSDKGVFNFEGGCYAKCINLNQESEPQISYAVFCLKKKNGD